MTEFLKENARTVMRCLPDLLCFLHGNGNAARLDFPAQPVFSLRNGNTGVNHPPHVDSDDFVRDMNEIIVPNGFTLAQDDGFIARIISDEIMPDRNGFGYC